MKEQMGVGLRKLGMAVFLGNMTIHAFVGAIAVHGPAMGTISMAMMMGFTAVLYKMEE